MITYVKDLYEKTKNYLTTKYNLFFSYATLDKLKREWYTFAIATGALLVYTYDSLVAANLDISKLVPDAYQSKFNICVLLLMLLLRRYIPKDASLDTPKEETPSVNT